MTIHDIIDSLHSDPAGISSKFNIPLPTVYGWCNGNRQPPAYVIGMMNTIIKLEGLNNGIREEGLEDRMGSDSKGKPEAGKAC